MKLNSRIISAVGIAITCVVTAAACYYKKRYSEINEVMVFCKLQYNPHSYFDKLLGYIERARRSINVCMPGLHNPAIQGRLVELIKRKNIKVRIIMDRSGYNSYSEVFIKELINAGAEIKCKLHSTYKMQHKFCLIDDDILMTGTLNWGDDRSFDHWNYVYITNKSQLVEPVKKEFYQMWDDYPSNMWELLDADSKLYEQDTEDQEILVEDSQNEFVNIANEVNSLRKTEMTPELCIL